MTAICTMCAKRDADVILNHYCLVAKGLQAEKTGSLHKNGCDPPTAPKDAREYAKWKKEIPK